MMKNCVLLLLVACTICCAPQQHIGQLKNGDIIFVEAQEQQLSGAISRVTQSDKKAISYDHTALVEIKGKQRNILHASGENGSEKIPLKEFVRKNLQEKRTMGVYRVKERFAHCTESAIEKANSLLGKPYNFLYLPTDDALYCSDLVERAYRQCQIFSLQPMTFINPQTGQTDDFWKELYQKHNTKIPEGVLGCNPNGIAKSEKIDFLFYIQPKK